MIKNVRAPYGEVGKLESAWYPLVLDADGRAVDPDGDENRGIDLPEIDSPQVGGRLLNHCIVFRCVRVFRRVSFRQTGKILHRSWKSITASPPRANSNAFRQDLIGLPWTYRFEVKASYGLPLTCASAYCQYELLGETFTTETVQPDPPSASPVLNYSFVHRVGKVGGVVETWKLLQPSYLHSLSGKHLPLQRCLDGSSTIGID